jgi:hypothetical protein
MQNLDKCERRLLALPKIVCEHSMRGGEGG